MEVDIKSLPHLEETCPYYSGQFLYKINTISFLHKGNGSLCNSSSLGLYSKFEILVVNLSCSCAAVGETTYTEPFFF